jgi:hypothetical protein
MTDWEPHINLRQQAVISPPAERETSSGTLSDSPQELSLFEAVRLWRLRWGRSRECLQQIIRIKESELPHSQSLRIMLSGHQIHTGPSGMLFFEVPLSTFTANPAARPACRRKWVWLILEARSRARIKSETPLEPSHPVRIQTIASRAVATPNSRRCRGLGCFVWR